MEYGKSLSVAAFKEMHNTSSLEVVKNPNNGKLFVVAGGLTVAAVSKNYNSSEDKGFVELIPNDGDEPIWCLYNPKVSEENIVETL